MNTNPAIANQFYQGYFMGILKDILEVLTGGFHKSGLKMQGQILCTLIYVTVSNIVIDLFFSSPIIC